MLRFAPATVQVERKNGNIYLRSPQKLAPYARCVSEWLVQWSDKEPTRTFLAERKGEGWRELSYRETYGAVRRIAQALLDQGVTAERPVAILSDNSIDHALLALGAMHAGIPVAPISPAYSLMSKDHAKLKAIFELLKPGLVFAQDAAKFAPALAAVGATATPIAELLHATPGLVETTVKNLREISPTIYFNVPRGFDLLLPFLETDTDLRRNFFRKLDAVFYAGAALPQNLWERLEALAIAENGGTLSMLSAWGSTETSPMATSVHYHIDRAGVVGNPGPGTELK